MKTICEIRGFKIPRNKGTIKLASTSIFLLSVGQYNHSESEYNGSVQ